jgi:hypothetical protein
LGIGTGSGLEVEESETTQVVDTIGAPDRSRTCNLLIRSQVLYPIELRAHALLFNDLGELGNLAEWASVKLGVKTGGGFPQIAFQEAIVPLKDFQCLVSRNFHDCEMVNACSAHIRNGGMPEFMEMKSQDTRSATGRIERRFDGPDRLALDQEHMVFLEGS